MNIDEKTNAADLAAMLPHIGGTGFPQFPKGWAKWKNVQLAHRTVFERRRREIMESQEIVTGGGNGVVTMAGRHHHASLFSLLSTIRENSANDGCPVEVWYFGSRGEIDAQHHRIFSCFKNVTLRDIDAHPDWALRRRREPWDAKPFCIAKSSFQRVLWIDVDNRPLRDLSYYFDLLISHNGVVFWPDSTWHDPKPSMLEALPCLNWMNPSVESGQILIDRVKYHKELAYAVMLSDHSDFCDEIIYGDKDRFPCGFTALGTLYTVAPHRPRFITHTLVHYDWDKQELFHHRTRDKLSLAPVKTGQAVFGTGQYFFRNRYEPSLSSEVDIFRHLGDYRVLVTSISDLKLIKQIEDQKDFRYVIVGKGCRLMTLLPDGEITEGAAGREVGWRVNNGRLFIEGSDATITAVLTFHDDCWSGQWVIPGHEMVMLVPLGVESRR